MDDFEVIRRVKGGDTEAFAVVVERYHRPLLNFIYRLVGDGSIVEDLGQDVFLKVYKTLGDFDEKRGVPFSAWLFIAARNRCLSELRQRRGRIKVDVDALSDLGSDEPGAEELLLESERKAALLDSLSQLPEPYLTTILQSLDGKSLEAIASREGISPGTVKSRLFRARAQIKKMVRDYFGGEKYEKI